MSCSYCKDTWLTCLTDRGTWPTATASITLLSARAFWPGAGFCSILPCTPCQNASLPLSPDQSVHQFQTPLFPEETAAVTSVSAFAALGRGGLPGPDMTAVVDTSSLDNECVPCKVHMPALLMGRCQTPVWEGDPVRCTSQNARGAHEKHARNGTRPQNVLLAAAGQDSCGTELDLQLKGSTFMED